MLHGRAVIPGVLAASILFFVTVADLFGGDITRYTFSQHHLPNTGIGWSPIAASDINGDGRDDLIVLSHWGIEVLLSKGNGTFQDPVITAIDGLEGTLSFGDFNKDGNIDVAIAFPRILPVPPIFPGQRGRLMVYLGRGDGSFDEPVQYLFGFACTSAVVADFNGDRNLDLLVTGDNVAVLLGNGDGTFQTGPFINLGHGCDLAAIGDFNGDGINDSIVEGGRQTSVLIGLGDGTFTNTQTMNISTLSSAMVTGDFNGDGHTDFAVSTFMLGFGLDPSRSVGVYVFMGTGDGRFLPAANYIASTHCHTMVTADFNGDGHLDLAIAEWGSGTIPVLLMQGKADGSFDAPVRLYPPYRPESIVAGDFNSDGKIDFATTSFPGQCSLFLNLPNRKVVRPPAPRRQSAFTKGLAGRTGN